MITCDVIARAAWEQKLGAIRSDLYVCVCGAMSR